MMELSGTYLTVPGLFNPAELDLLERLIESAHFESGAATATDAAKSVKNNLQIPKQSGIEKQQIDAIFYNAVMNSPLIQAAIMPVRILPPIISKYEPGMFYGYHVDSPLMGDMQSGPIRTDVGMTIFLSDPADYEGGELSVFTDHGEARFKLNKGDAIIYPTTQVHAVLPVSAGRRTAAVSWMQCAVRDMHRRELLFQLKSAQALVERQNPQSPENHTLLQVYSNLVRMWAEL